MSHCPFISFYKIYYSLLSVTKTVLAYVHPPKQAFQPEAPAPSVHCPSKLPGTHLPLPGGQFS